MAFGKAGRVPFSQNAVKTGWEHDCGNEVTLMEFTFKDDATRSVIGLNIPGLPPMSKSAAAWKTLFSHAEAILAGIAEYEESASLREKERIKNAEYLEKLDDLKKLEAIMGPDLYAKNVSVLNQVYGKGVQRTVVHQ